MSNRKEIFLADLDGTLTVPRSQMSVEMINFLDDFLDKHDMYIVTGSDFAKVKEQVPEYILKKFKNTFACMGNTIYKGMDCISETPKIIDPKLDRELKSLFHYENQYYVKYNNTIEYRPGMINFSFLGRDCPFIERDRYYEWDQAHGQRKFAVDLLKSKFPDYDFEIGGKISIDIIKKGCGKDQVVALLQKWAFEPENITFIGDKTYEGGNDYSVAKAVENTEGGFIVQVEDDKDTLKFLRSVKG